MATYLCFDLGASHTGVSQSIEGEIATPVGTIEEKDIDKLKKKLLSLIQDTKPDVIVIGRPEFGPFIPTINEISAFLKTNCAGEFVEYTEDLSTKVAAKKMFESSKSLTKRQADSHQFAAAVILQEYLNSIN